MTEADENEARLIREQGKADWRAFVISRGRELKPGGFIVTMNLSSDEENNDASHVENGTRLLFSFLSDMAREGVITQEEYLATNYHGHHLRTPADFKEPFTSDLPEVGELGQDLVSVKSFKHFLKHPTFNIIDKGETEKLEYSRAIVASIYPWLHHSLYDGLSLSRSEEEKQMIIDQYFSRLEAYAFANSDHKPYVFYTEVVIKKRMHNEGL
ncbi:uncharacterized protein LOC110462117 [Mizuhopecten yessoensis]|uniref:uncharacterized protein LOC110462117 n=1 Tax=Mizuhopecten yessoensis TaxID=6573 RepID=UPI000B4594A9|nr:uncharacterized protein LOC110462117 [Mizuhopecten yessoensis]